MNYSLELANRFILIFFSLFVLVDPIAIVPTFLALTKKIDRNQIEIIIRRACVSGAEVLIFFHLFGALIFKILGIHIDAFKIAGGILLFITALDMLKAKRADDKYSVEVDDADEKPDISIVPLAMPLLAGPGSITSVIIYSTDSNATFLENSTLAILAICLVFLISYFVLKYSVFIKTLMGRAGIAILERVMGILLTAISIQLIVEGVTFLVKRILHV